MDRWYWMWLQVRCVSFRRMKLRRCGRLFGVRAKGLRQNQRKESRNLLNQSIRAHVKTQASGADRNRAVAEQDKNKLCQVSCSKAMSALANSLRMDSSRGLRAQNDVLDSGSTCFVSAT